MPAIAPGVLRDIVGALADLAIVIDAGGHVRSILANPFHESLAELRQWEGADLRDRLTVESRPKFDAALARLKHEPHAPRSTELNHFDAATGTEFPVTYSLHPIDGVDGAGEILMLGRDLRSIADLQQQLVNAQIAIERDYEAQRGYDTRYRVLMQTSTEAMVFVAVGTGRIVDANPAAASLLGRTADELKGLRFAGLFDDSGRGELLAEMAASALSEEAGTVPLVLAKDGTSLRGAPSFFRAAGTRMMLCRLDSATGQSRQSPSGTARSLEALYETGPDAIVFTNAGGVIAAANEAFLDLTDIGTASELQGRPLSDFLERGTVDMNVLLDGTRRAGRMRIYTTRIGGRIGTSRPAEISSTHLADADRSSFAFVIRDAQIAEAARSIGGESGAERHASVVELVGSATLREIVADTTDVIEKMCIQTAIELTSNNRVAAAEMLGLSRQSLYVKLRKYDLLSQPDGD